MSDLRVFKWWWAWNHEKMESWLEEMEMSGYRLSNVTWGGIVFCFERCTPRKTRYCIDYQQKLTPQYMAILQHDGWQLYQMGMSWYVCRKEYTGERPQLYSDYDSVIERYKKLIVILIACSLPFVSSGRALMRNVSDTGSGFFSVAFSGIYILAAIFLFYSFFKLLTTIKVLKKKKSISMK